MTLPSTFVLCVYTGGTIGMERSANGYIPRAHYLENYLASVPSFNESPYSNSTLRVLHKGEERNLKKLSTPLNAYGRKVEYCILEYDKLVDSSSITHDDWVSMATTIEDNYQWFDAFIILHGTDSMAYTSSALSYMLENLGKTIILTGSQVSLLLKCFLSTIQIPFSQLYNDAVNNLLGSLIITGSFVIPEVSVYFNHTLFRGNRYSYAPFPSLMASVTKISSTAFSAFESPNFPCLIPQSVTINPKWHLILRPQALSPFRVQSVLSGAVASLRLFPGMEVSMISSLLSSGIKGLVLETFGTGNTPQNNELFKAMQDVKDRIVIVNCTQCNPILFTKSERLGKSGSVNAFYASGIELQRAGVLCGYDLTLEAALTKLSYLLGKYPNDVSTIRKYMKNSIRGEMTITQATPRFRAPAQSLWEAVKAGDIEAAESGTSVDENEINVLDESGLTPLCLSISLFDEPMVRKLLSLGASVHLRTRTGHSPLFLASERGQNSIIQLLRSDGAHFHPEEMLFIIEKVKGAVKDDNVTAIKVWELAGVEIRQLRDDEGREISHWIEIFGARKVCEAWESCEDKEDLWGHTPVFYKERKLKENANRLKS
ncbi:lysophospholipase [Neolecta irregularis DAH-3]|uniref:asparaginase n=1 Tax=Neolecta irregularis (strain DAH-3) TaxID=1198029 RepID=A0A1U7LGV4_NEOID|nr:lysophospholipase [Neolecta irregularis DAH-3]|eukprot:OLL21884.1 lysophospholipase [Neolecta irregularis DAH-3]